MKAILLLLIVTFATVNLFEASGLGGHRSHRGSSLSFDDDSRSEDSGDSGSRDADSSDESSEGTSEGSSEDGSSGTSQRSIPL